MSGTNTCDNCGKEVGESGYTAKPDGNRICYPKCNPNNDVEMQEHIDEKTELFSWAYPSRQEITVTPDQHADIINKLIKYLHKASSNGMKRQNIIERLTHDSLIPPDVTDAHFWRVIKKIIDYDGEIMVVGNKRGTTYYLKEYFESTELSESTIPMMKKLMDTYPENGRFEKKSILDLFPSKTLKELKGGGQITYTRLSANERIYTLDIGNGVAYLLKTNQLFREGTGRGTRYFWSNDDNPFQETGPRERISIKLPAKMSRWLRAKSADGGPYRSKAEVIEQAVRDKFGEEIDDWVESS